MGGVSYAEGDPLLCEIYLIRAAFSLETRHINEHKEQNNKRKNLMFMQLRCRRRHHGSSSSDPSFSLLQGICRVSQSSGTGSRSCQQTTCCDAHASFVLLRREQLGGERLPPPTRASSLPASPGLKGSNVSEQIVSLRDTRSPSVPAGAS